MKFLKAIMIVAVAASALSLGACAQKKETVDDEVDGDHPTRSNRPACPPADSFNLKGQVVHAAWPFFAAAQAGRCRVENSGAP